MFQVPPGHKIGVAGENCAREQIRGKFRQTSPSIDILNLTLPLRAAVRAGFRGRLNEVCHLELPVSPKSPLFSRAPLYDVARPRKTPTGKTKCLFCYDHFIVNAHANFETKPPRRGDNIDMIYVSYECFAPHGSNMPAKNHFYPIRPKRSRLPASFYR